VNSEVNGAKTVNEPRFEFGKNWNKFLKLLDETRISEAEKSIQVMLETVDLNNRRFLDIGSGSGLFSLAARRLGATVHSFDYDSECVACTEELKHRYYPMDKGWRIEQGDVLDVMYLNSLGKYDIVYSWGVLHHTGNMWAALENVARLVDERGKLFISIYNDQGILSQFWKTVKRSYNQSSKPVRVFILLGVGSGLQTGGALIRLLEGQNPLPLKNWTQRRRNRGMSVWHDLVDWVGGYPFEVAKPEEVFEFYKKRGFNLLKLKTRSGGFGCNEYVFTRESAR
jgi:2-polyprenyl-3-methyl-5-hydroxy-6-metoxy-1,4-benzoquinol methylase